MPRGRRRPPDEIQPIDGRGQHTNVPPLAIDAVHRNGVLHKSLWLHVLSSDSKLLLITRSKGLAACPGRLSIVGEHHTRRETDEHCARRANHVAAQRLLIGRLVRSTRCWTAEACDPDETAGGRLAAPHSTQHASQPHGVLSIARERAREPAGELRLRKRGTDALLISLFKPSPHTRASF